MLRFTYLFLRYESCAIPIVVLVVFLPNVLVSVLVVVCNTSRVSCCNASFYFFFCVLTVVCNTSRAFDRSHT